VLPSLVGGAWGRALSPGGAEDKLRSLRPFTMVCLGHSLDLLARDGLHEAGRYGEVPRGWSYPAALAASNFNHIAYRAGNVNRTM
jgi:hypothetical protein